MGPYPVQGEKVRRELNQACVVSFVVAVKMRVWRQLFEVSSLRHIMTHNGQTVFMVPPTPVVSA